VLALDRPEEARPVLQEALAVYERKGIVPFINDTRGRLDQLGRSASVDSPPMG
jgi:hypothetical protein